MTEPSAGSRAESRGDRQPRRGNDAVTGAAGASRGRATFVLARPWVTLACRLLLAGVLGYAGLLKVGDPLTAARAVRAYQILPTETLVTMVGYGLPFLEIAVAVLLVAGLGVKVSGVVAGVLMLVFIAGIISVLARGISIDCGCFGGGGVVTAGETRYLQEILRDAGLLLAAAWTVLFPSGRFALDGVILGDDLHESR